MGQRRARPAQAGDNIAPQAAAAKPSGKRPGASAQRQRAKAGSRSETASGGLTRAELRAKLSELANAVPAEYSDEPDWAKLTAGVAAADAPQLLALADQEMPKSKRAGLRLQLLQRWAEADAPAAMAYAQALAGRLERTECANAVAAVWAEADAAGAVAWLSRLPADRSRDSALQAMLSAISKKDPQGALNLLQTYAVSQADQMVWTKAVIIGNWAVQDPPAALAKAVEVLKGEHLSQAYRSIAAAWAQRDPQAAMAWADTLANASDKRDAGDSILAV